MADIICQMIEVWTVYKIQIKRGIYTYSAWSMNLFHTYFKKEGTLLGSGKTFISHLDGIELEWLQKVKTNLCVKFLFSFWMFQRGWIFFTQFCVLSVCVISVRIGQYCWMVIDMYTIFMHGLSSKFAVEQ